MTHQPDPRLIALLAWYRDMGVTDALTDDPLDWLALGDRADLGIGHGSSSSSAGRDQGARIESQAPRILQSGTPSAPLPAAQRAFVTKPTSEAEDSARAAASSAASLEELRAALERFDGCALRATAKNLCFYRGAPHGRVMIIGEAPGREEDLEGKPFVGRAGQLLDKMLAAIGLSEADVHITNIVYWRPPGNRTPTPQEALVCRPFLMRQIELVQPEFLLLLGAAAAKHLLGGTEGILRIRGKWREVEVGGRLIPAMASLHPAYLLRSPAQKRLAWRDLLALKVRLDHGDQTGAAKGASG